MAARLRTAGLDHVERDVAPLLAHVAVQRHHAQQAIGVKEPQGVRKDFNQKSMVRLQRSASAASSAEQMTVAGGQELRVLARPNADWWYCAPLDGSGRGYLPAAYVRLASAVPDAAQRLAGALSLAVASGAELGARIGELDSKIRQLAAQGGG